MATKKLWTNQRIRKDIPIECRHVCTIIFEMRDEYEAALAYLRYEVAQLEVVLAEAEALLDVESK
jgi:hypothetical protein